MNTIKLGNTPMSFVYQGNELLYPNPVKDGLVLWYDFKGMKNNDVSKDVAKDLSGHSIDGFLENFNFSNGTGYSKEGLILDGVDDYIEVTYYNTKPEKNNDYLYTFVISKENSKILFFIDGKLVQENSFNGNPKKSDKNLFFGKSAYNNSEVLNGIIKSIQIYNRALSDQEIQHNYQLEKERWNL